MHLLRSNPDTIFQEKDLHVTQIIDPGFTGGSDQDLILSIHIRDTATLRYAYCLPPYLSSPTDKVIGRKQRYIIYTYL